MPLGHIQPRQLTATQIFRLDRLSLLWYPNDEKQLRHLSREDFMSWLYMMNPRMALIWAGLPKFRAIMEYQKDKRWHQEIRDTVWRHFYGVI